MKTDLVGEQTKTNSAPIIIAVLMLTVVSTAVITAVIKHLRVNQFLTFSTFFVFFDKHIEN